MIIGSMAFVKDMVAVQKELQSLGHDVSIPADSDPHLQDADFVDSLTANVAFCIENNTMKRNFDMVAAHDAVLVLNHRRNDIDGYIGTSALLEMGIAHFHGKKLFLYNAQPDYNLVRWAHEVAIMQPVILDEDLSKIK